GKDDGKGDLIELDTRPVGGAVDPEVLGETAVGSLGAGEVDKSAKSSLCAVTCKQRRRGLNHVARPDEVITAEVGVSFGSPPGNGGRGDKSSGVSLVFVRKDDVMADVGEPAAIGG